MREDEASGAGPMPSHVDENTGLPGPPVTGPAPSAGFFPDDLMNPTTDLSARYIESDVDLDILHDAFGYAVIPEPTSLALLLAGIGTSALRRPRTVSG